MRISDTSLNRCNELHYNVFRDKCPVYEEEYAMNNTSSVRLNTIKDNEQQQMTSVAAAVRYG